MENFGKQPFNLSDIEGLPYPYYIQYQNNLTRYTQYAQWFYGDALNDIETEKSGEQVPLYPVRYNPIFDMVLKHATALFGEFIDDGRPLVVPKLVSSGETDVDLTKTADEALSMLWWENFGR